MAPYEEKLVKKVAHGKCGVSYDSGKKKLAMSPVKNKILAKKSANLKRKNQTIVLFAESDLN